MPHRIEIIDAKESDIEKAVGRKFGQISGKPIESVQIVSVYTLDKTMTREEIKLLERELCHPVLEKIALPYNEADIDGIVEIGLRPGTMDPDGMEARSFAQRICRMGFEPNETVFFSKQYRLKLAAGESEKLELDAQDLLKIAESLANPTSDTYFIRDKTELKERGIEGIDIPRVRLKEPLPVIEVSLEVNDSRLAEIGSKGIPYQMPLTDHAAKEKADKGEINWGGQLALDLEQMHTLRDYAREKRRNLTDIEIELIAQTWSEHCQHGTFKAVIDYEDCDDIPRKRKVSLFDIIKDASLRNNEKKSLENKAVSLFKDNAGVFPIDKENNLAIKAETHNHPSGLDPYGGSNTGTGGVIRDPLGTGIGYEPCFTQGLFFVPSLSQRKRYYREKSEEAPENSKPENPDSKDSKFKLVKPLLHPKELLSGIIDGSRDYGNQYGLPGYATAIFHDGFQKPGVFVWCYGRQKKLVNEKPSHEKKANPGDTAILAGGRAGNDGFHGATGSSVTFTIQSASTDVQKGNPPEQKRLEGAILECLNEGINGMGLYTSITDLGAGGVACALPEMGQESGGVEIDLDAIPTKYANMSDVMKFMNRRREWPLPRILIIPIEFCQYSKSIIPKQQLSEDSQIRERLLLKAVAKQLLTLIWIFCLMETL